MVILWQWAVRILFVLAPGIIHPDEHFQSIVPVYNYIYGIETNDLPWEFRSGARSFGPLFVTYGIPIYLLKILCISSPFVLFLMTRIAMFLYSLILDYFVFKIAPKGYNLYLTSAIVMVFSFRSFSNTIELYLVCLTLLFNNPILLGAITTIGLFNRITYPLFVVPYLLHQCYLKFKSNSFFSFIFFYFKFLVGAGTVATIFITIDTFIYNGDLILPLRIPIIDNLLYNLEYDNLQQHGIHPRFTHVLVNVPLLFGPLLFSYFKQLYLGIDRNAIFAIFPIFALSLFPHQEPRFLIPVFPYLLLYIRNNSQSFNVSFKPQLFHGLLIGTIFYFHQGGLIPIALNHKSVDRIYFYKTYGMPHLFMPTSTVINVGNSREKMKMVKDDFVVMPSLGDCACWTSYTCEFGRYKLEYVGKQPHLSFDHGLDILVCVWKVK